MAALRGTKVIRVGSSGIPAYDSLEEITSPTEGMVVKINGQEGGSGTPRGVEVGDVLNNVTFSGSPYNVLGNLSLGNKLLLTFEGDYKLYAIKDDDMLVKHMLALVYNDQFSNATYICTYLDSDINSEMVWQDGYSSIGEIVSSYNFNGRRVAPNGINDASIQSVIIVTPSAPAIPDKYYIYKDSEWVELVDVSGTTAEEADVKDGEVFYKADGTQSEGTLVPLDISDSNAAVGDVVASKTFYATSGGKKTGTMTDRGTVSTDITTKAQQVTIAAGKHSGSGVVKISATEQAKIIAGNIKSGVTILGQAGSVTAAKEEETKTVTSPDFSSGNIVVTPTSGKVMTQVTINKDTTNHVAGNIKDGVTLYGVEGTAKIAIEITQDDYDYITTPDENVYYIIIEEA